MKIIAVTANNRTKAFEVRTRKQTFPLPYVRAKPAPSRENRVREVWVDPEIANEGFTYVLESGAEGTVHLDQVLEYNEDPTYLRDELLYRLTIEAQERVSASRLSKREIIRRLGTSASQFYRVLDQTNYTKSVGQLLALLHIVGREVDFTVRRRKRKTA